MDFEAPKVVIVLVGLCACLNLVWASVRFCQRLILSKPTWGNLPSKLHFLFLGLPFLPNLNCAWYKLEALIKPLHYQHIHLLHVFFTLHNWNMHCSCWYSIYVQVLILVRSLIECTAGSTGKKFMKKRMSPHTTTVLWKVRHLSGQFLRKPDISQLPYPRVAFLSLRICLLQRSLM